MLGSFFSRRDIFRVGGLAAAARAKGAAATKALEPGPRMYESIGVRPLINCRGTLTIISGSQTLPEVKRAMEEASRHYVHIDELMEAVGERLAQLTGAEYGIVTSGCAAALAHLTATCVAGADPEKIQRLPNLEGMKNEVICPTWSRNVYDHAVRMVGVKMINAPDRESFASAFNEKTAMVMVMAGPKDTGEFGLPYISEVAKQKGIPVIVDAAAEDLTIPNVHLQRGATVVLYSGGKILRGPQCAGLALGSKELLKAMWVNCSPHHTFGRPMKVGKEEIAGMLAAVEAWTRRDRDAEMREQTRWLQNIARTVERVPGVKTAVMQTNPQDLSNRGPRLKISWDPAAVGIMAGELERILYEGSPRIDMGMSNYNREPASGSVTIAAQMMMPGEDKVVGERIHAVLAHPPKQAEPKKSGEPAIVAGSWRIQVEFLRGSATHAVTFEQNGGELRGSHSTTWLNAELRGAVTGNEIRFRTAPKYEGTHIEYIFTGQVAGDRIGGICNLGEYGEARWSAVRA